MMQIAILIPCHNEEAAIGNVVRDFAAAVPEATIYVYDNNSSDPTREIATKAGAQVRAAPLRAAGYGYGHAHPRQPWRLPARPRFWKSPAHRARCSPVRKPFLGPAFRLPHLFAPLRKILPGAGQRV